MCGVVRGARVGLLWLLPALLLTGCVNVGEHRASLEAAGERMEDARETLEPPGPVAEPGAPEGARLIEAPREQAWLYRPTGPVDYHLTLREVVAMLVPDRPANYRMATYYNPMVKSPLEARSLKDHMDSIALQANVDWSYRAGALVFSTMVTRQYHLPTFGGSVNNTRLNANNLGVASTSEGSGTGVTNSFEATVNLMAEMERLVNTSLGILPCQRDLENLSQQGQGQGFGGQGFDDDTDDDQTKRQPRQTLAGVPRLRKPTREQECYSVSGAANLLTITARPQTLVRFEEAYYPFVEGLKRSALLKIITIKLDVTDLTQQRLDLDLVRTGSRFVGGGQGATLFSNITSDLTSSQAAEQGVGGAVFSAGLVDPGSPWNGSSLLLQSLESITNMTVEDSRELLAYSNRLITIQDTERFNYISELQRDPETVGQTTTIRTNITTDAVVTGQSLNILPSLTEDTISLHIVINEASLTRLKVNGTGDTRISLPDTSNSDVVFDVTLGDRETALIASTIRAETQLREDKSGILPIRWLDRFFSNSNEGQQRIYQTVYLIEARFQAPVPLS